MLDWKELARIRKNSVQELEIFFFVIIGYNSFSFFVILFHPNINLKRMRVMRVISPQIPIILRQLRINYAHYGNSFLFLAFGEHEFPRITHELLMKYYYMEHYMGHYMCITCCVADKNSFAWYWKELVRMRKNSAQELEKKLCVLR